MPKLYIYSFINSYILIRILTCGSYLTSVCKNLVLCMCTRKVLKINDWNMPKLDKNDKLQCLSIILLNLSVEYFFLLIYIREWYSDYYWSFLQQLGFLLDRQTLFHYYLLMHNCKSNTFFQAYFVLFHSIINAIKCHFQLNDVPNFLIEVNFKLFSQSH